MTVLAYIRVSTKDQDLAPQQKAILKRHPGAIIRAEKISGTKSHTSRPMLDLLLETIQANDVLVVWKMDRLGRNVKDLLTIVEKLDSIGASLQILDQSIDTKTASGKAFLQMLSVFAEFETNLRKERQLIGIEKAKSEGKYKGRKAKIDKALINQLIENGLKPKNICEQLNISRSTYYRLSC